MDGSTRLLVTYRPYVISDRGEIGLGELGATQGRHHPLVLLRLRYALRDRPGDRLEAAVAPQPLAARQIGTLGGALAVRAVTSCAGPLADVSVEDAITQGDLVR